MKGAEAFVERERNAYRRLVEAIVERGGIGEAEARKVADLYLSRSVRAAKLDRVGGSFVISHGAYMDRDVIRRAAEGAKS